MLAAPFTLASLFIFCRYTELCQWSHCNAPVQKVHFLCAHMSLQSTVGNTALHWAKFCTKTKIISHGLHELRKSITSAMGHFCWVMFWGRQGKMPLLLALTGFRLFDQTEATHLHSSLFKKNKGKWVLRMINSAPEWYTCGIHSTSGNTGMEIQRQEIKNIQNKLQSHHPWRSPLLHCWTALPKGMAHMH